MPFLHTATEKIYYEVHSPVFTDQTDTIVMIYSVITDHTLFDSITAELTQHYSVIQYDLRETGNSASATGRYHLRLILKIFSTYYIHYI
ncbi:hypothetical protein AAAC51_16485 [Priestia megaterium]